MAMKTCTKCQESKALDRFGKDGRTRDRLRKVCEDCRTAPVAAPPADDTRKGLTSPQTAVESAFEDIVKGLGPLDVPEIPWATGLGDISNRDMVDAFSGVMIAVLRKDYEAVRFLLGQTCKTWQDITLFLSAVIGDLVDYSIPEEEKESLIQTEYGLIKKNIHHWA
ncbi:hypothetical protein AB0945_18860 [Streptomyces sp. NPDC005474]|uniref:hypothetical protein n=1 Tax=Streptomyces sp. NPDC005474 TaxID=3154878 RepID=UPI003452EDC9